MRARGYEMARREGTIETETETGVEIGDGGVEARSGIGESGKEVTGRGTEEMIIIGDECVVSGMGELSESSIYMVVDGFASLAMVPFWYSRKRIGRIRRHGKLRYELIHLQL